jgi:hypothetical protein
MAARYVHNYAAFDRLVLCAPFMLAFAEAHAPFDPDDPDGTHYKDSFELAVGTRVIQTRRAYARVSNTDMPTALFVEWGNRNTPRHRTLGAALSAAKD